MIFVNGVVVVFAAIFPLSQKADFSAEKGKDLYLQHCVSCHGLEGMGNGPIAHFLEPKPRDFSSAKFRIVSTENGVPSEEDLMAVLRRGMPGSWMPSYDHLAEDEKIALTKYLRTLISDGVKKRAQEHLVKLGEKIDPEDFARYLREKTLPGVLIEVPSEPRPTEESLERGRHLFVRNCASCHGMEGRGDGRTKMQDDRGALAKPRDLTKGIFKGSSDPQSLYRRIYNGLPGSPMPAYFHLDSQSIWDLVHFVRTAPMPGSEERTLPQRRNLYASRKSSVPSSPTDRVWNDVPATFLSLMPLWWQDVRVEGLLVRAIHDGKDLGVQISWIDTSRNDLALRFPENSDAAAVQFASGAEPTVGLGDSKDPVNLWYWRANWEKECQGSCDLQVFYPGMKWNPYPWASQLYPKEMEEKVQDSGEKELHRVQASADWMDPGWVVMFRRPLSTAESRDIVLAPAQRVSIAFSVWDAAEGSRQSQCSVTVWHDLFLEK